MGRLVGVRYEDLPEHWAELLAYFDEMVERELEDTEAARDVLRALHDPVVPPLPRMPDRLWRIVCRPPASAGTLATLGLLPPILRERLGVEWSAGRELGFRTLARSLSRLGTADAAAGEELRAEIPALARPGGRPLGCRRPFREA